jgi:hypothetical protein
VVEGHGPAGAFLNFCPGSAAVRTGDPLQVYPEAVLRMEETERVLAKKRVSLPIVQ